MSGLGRIPRRRAQYSGLLRSRRPRRTKGAFANPPWPPDCVGLSEASEGQWWESIAEAAARAAPSFSPSRQGLKVLGNKQRRASRRGRPARVRPCRPPPPVPAQRPAVWEPVCCCRGGPEIALLSAFYRTLTRPDPSTLKSGHDFTRDSGLT